MPASSKMTSDSGAMAYLRHRWLAFSWGLRAVCSKISLAAFTARTSAVAARIREAFSAIDTPSTCPPLAAQARATAPIVVVFPVPAGPTKASRRRPEPNTERAALAWSPSSPTSSIAASTTFLSIRRSHDRAATW